MDTPMAATGGSPVNSVRTDINSYTRPFNDKYPRIRGIIGLQRSRAVHHALESAAAFYIRS